MNLIGEVEGARCIIIDDMVDTAGTLTQAAEVIMNMGAKEVMALATHPVLSGNAIKRINDCPLSMMAVTNSIPLTAEGREVPKIKVLSVAKLLSEAIRRIHQEDSISSLFV
jgi:ribose-phosphate pyrophosphokinase